MFRIILNGLSAILILLMFGSPALAGFVVHRKVKTQDDMSNRTKIESQVEYFDTNSGKFAGKNSIMNFDTGEMILLNPEQKTYYRNSVDGYCQDMQKMITVFTSSPQYQKMKKATEQMRKEMKKKYGDQAMPKAPKMTLHKVGYSRVAGYRAVHYQVMQGNQVDRDVWLADDPRLDALDPAKNPRLKKKALVFERRFKSCAEKFSELGPGGQKNVDPLEEDTRFELRTKDPYTDDITTSIERRSIPASRFEPPSGYRKVTLKGFMQSAGKNHSANLGRPAPGAVPTPNQMGNMPAAAAPAASPAQTEQKGMLKKDAEDVGQHTAQEAHDQTKNAVENKIDQQVKKGVKGLLHMFGN